MTRAAATLALVAFTACAHPRGPWVHASGAWDPQPYADAAERVTGDRKGLIRQGGKVYALPNLDAKCGGVRISGCAGPFHIYVLADRPPERTALAHELCHLGLERGGGYSGPVIWATEAQADACALIVHREVLP